MTDSLNLPLLVKQTRKRLALTQLEFAQRLGVSFQTVNRWENGKTKPLPMALKLIEQELQQMGIQGTDLLEQYFL
ncbi:helix-turn-helix domain-containing protein [Crocosphaera sp. UHCC 0190]|uniref:helix-turn-helix domain-containing protein n=1 Tax=Crocosphaera sp. UHCC 0190 TaxID=3110246 RepID=UPI002B1FDD08|nr:helix-turn-helix domain-containing protein [Crocosphaera sp. UHCC 0190]MEA5512262.1 helix-turn-helix domain-containing protein [Crocosphaera sp. UHCC 0190]